MELKEIEIQILLDIYEMDINIGKKIEYDNYELTEEHFSERKQEFANYLLRLKSFNYIDFDEEKVFIKAGIRSTKYKTNVISIQPEQIHITEKGINYINEIKKTVFDKAKDRIKGESKDIMDKVGCELKDFASKTIAEYFVRLTKKL